MRLVGAAMVMIGGFLLGQVLSDVTAATHAKDPTKMAVPIGVKTVAAGTPDEMRIILELESARPMLMPSVLMSSGAHAGLPMESVPATDQKYHFEVKAEDPRSNTRISYATVRFSALNTITGEKVEADLHPMWGSSGLHYGANGALLSDGTYTATVTVAPPSFARDASKDRDRWMRPVRAQFGFRLERGLVTVE